jgi:tetratricopeptide (TPR) repeat protein
MKEYLQLEGLAYKLVPIHTKNQSSFEMGRIDTDLMFDIVKGWDWGNSGSSEIYHDPQTRIQGLSFRGNLARLTEALIKENKIDEAKDVINIAMTNIPLEYYDFYAFVEPFVDGYYKVGETQKARDLFYKLRDIYQDRLDYYSSIPLDEQYDKIEDIIGDMEAYRRNIDILIENNDREMAEKETLLFNELIDMFSHFYKDEVLEEPALPEQSNPDILDTLEFEEDSFSGDSLNPGMELDSSAGGN